MRIVGLIGAKGSGKSTVAAMLEKHGWVRLRLGDPLKDMLRAIGLSEDEIEGELKETPCLKLGGVTPRRAMQTLGTEWGRTCMGNIWNSLLSQRIVALIEENPRVRIVVEDVRFPDQADTVRVFEGEIWRVRNSRVETRFSSFTRVLAHLGLSRKLHPSELHWSIIPADMVIHNDRAMVDLQAQVDPEASYATHL